MQKIKNFSLDLINKIKILPLRKKIIYGVIFLIVIFIIMKIIIPKDVSDTMVVDTVKYTDLKQNVLATGQVTSKTDLNLSFNASGVVKSLKVAVGDVVKEGQILANLDQGQVIASLTQAKGNLLSAQAKYNKVLSNQELNLAQVSLNSAKTELENTTNSQKILVSNAYNTLLNSTIEAVPEDYTNDYASPVISGTYTLGKEGVLNIKTYKSLNGYSFNVSGLTTGSGTLNYNIPQPLGNSGLYIKLPSETSDNTSTINWKITIPNVQAADYLTNLNAYQNALKNESLAVSSAQSKVDQKIAELNLKTSDTHQSDLDIANAEVLNAQGSLQSAQATYENTVIRAPADGTITKVDIKIGELAQSLSDVMVLQDIKNLYIEALINESNIAYLKIGQDVAVSFDAFGKDKSFTGSVVHIDPSSDTKDGVVNYKIKVSINEQNDLIRPGMNANINIEAGSKQNVLAIPGAAITKENGKSFVNFVTNEKKEKYEKREIVTGFVSDGNMVEIVSGLNVGDHIIFVQK